MAVIKIEACPRCEGDKNCAMCEGHRTIRIKQEDGSYVLEQCPDCRGLGRCVVCSGQGFLVARKGVIGGISGV